MSHSPVFAADQEPVGPGHLLLADHLADSLTLQVLFPPDEVPA